MIEKFDPWISRPGVSGRFCIIAIHCESRRQQKKVLLANTRAVCCCLFSMTEINKCNDGPSGSASPSLLSKRSQNH